mmetsp:Transcript_8013/g.10005  ORF Transcript_8013/g.10005 Transcript_8013/m.10005 type:complete len:104 (-) Transcript_8013:108-419(-)
MVAAEEGDVAGVFEFEAEEEGERLDGVVPSVDKVPQEDVGGVWGEVADGGGEEVEEVVELAVEVADNCDGGLDRLDVGLFHEEFRDGRAEALHRVLGDNLSGF